MRGNLDRNGYAQEIARVREKLSRLDGPHWREFLAAWQSDGEST
jgi:hypothetical protein